MNFSQRLASDCEKSTKGSQNFGLERVFFTPLLLSVIMLPALFTVAPLATAQSSSGQCSVTENSLAAARQAFANQCAVNLVDCDPLGNQWQCASFQLGNASPANTNLTISSGAPAQPVAPNTHQASPAPTALNHSPTCAVSASSLSASRELYSVSCALPRVDCDLLDGRWTCAAFAMGTAPASQQINPSSSGSNTGITYGGNFGPPQRSWMDSYSANGRCFVASNFDHGIADVLVQTPAGMLTVKAVAEALGTGPGVGNNPIYNDVQCGHGPANNAGDEDVNQCPGRVDLGAAGCSMRGPLWDLSIFEAPDSDNNSPESNTMQPIIEPVVAPSVTSPNFVSNGISALPDRSRFAHGDLLSIHYDNAGDRDDGIAAAATIMVLDYFGLKNSIHVVNGTYDERTPHFYQSASEPLMREVFGAENQASGWWNAHTRYEESVRKTLEIWRATLQSGNKVWVAEGGTSDFTSEVLRRMRNQQINNLKSIFVIQHSQYNNNFTVPKNLEDTKNIASHMSIPDGNYVGNGTTGLNQQNDAVARSFLNSPTYSDVWRSAYNYLPAINCGNPSQQCKFDGSDAVAVLYIVGDEMLRDWTEFSYRYYR